MKISASIELIWQLAGGEASTGEFAEIQPEHFCMGLLKFSELSEQQARKVVGEGEAAKGLVAEIQSVREALAKSSIDTTQVRRNLRAKLGKGGIRNGEGKLHRSPASRELLQIAATLAAEAGSDSLTSLHLLAAILKSPSPAIAQAFHGAVVSPPQRIETPILDKCGKDLTQMALQEESLIDKVRTAECKAILQVLARKKSLFLVAKTMEASRSTLMALAKCLHADEMSRPLSDRRRLIEIHLCPSGYEEARPGTLDQMYGEMLSEAARCPNVILVCAFSDMCTQTDLCRTKLSPRSSRLATTQTLCIVPINEQDYEKHVKTDQKWKRLAESVWVRNRERSLPKEL